MDLKQICLVSRLIWAALPLLILVYGVFWTGCVLGICVFLAFIFNYGILPLYDFNNQFLTKPVDTWGMVRFATATYILDQRSDMPPSPSAISHTYFSFPPPTPSFSHRSILMGLLSELCLSTATTLGGWLSPGCQSWPQLYWRSQFEISLQHTSLAPGKNSNTTVVKSSVTNCGPESSSPGGVVALASEILSS
jgi:hypothetical protein